MKRTILVLIFGFSLLFSIPRAEALDSAKVVRYTKAFRLALVGALNIHSVKQCYEHCYKKRCQYKQLILSVASGPKSDEKKLDGLTRFRINMIYSGYLPGLVALFVSGISLFQESERLQFFSARLCAASLVYNYLNMVLE